MLHEGFAGSKPVHSDTSSGKVRVRQPLNSKNDIQDSKMIRFHAMVHRR